METSLDNEQLTTRQACDLIAELLGERPTAETVRDWCKVGFGGPLDRDPIILPCERNKLGHFVIRRSEIKKFVARTAQRKAELAEFDAWRLMKKVTPKAVTARPAKRPIPTPTPARVAQRPAAPATPIETLARAIDHTRQQVARPSQSVVATTAAAESSNRAVWMTVAIVGAALAGVGWAIGGQRLIDPFVLFGLACSGVGLVGRLCSTR